MFLQLLNVLSRKSSRTQKSASAKPVKSFKPAIEQLEDRRLMSVAYFSDPRGTYAYNTYNNSLRQIAVVQPKMMSSNQGGLLYAGYNSGSAVGTYQYNYGSNSWQRLSSLVPVAMDNGAPTLWVSYNTGTAVGTWEYANQTWHKISNKVALQIAAVGPGITYCAFADGIQKYEEYANRWTKIGLPAGTTNLYKMDVAGSCLVVSLNTGTWMSSYNTNGWKRLTTEVANDIGMNDTNDFYVSLTSGTYRYNNGTWTRIANHAQHIAANENGYHSTVLVGAWSDGTYAVSNGKWTKLSSYQASFIA